LHAAVKLRHIAFIVQCACCRLYVYFQCSELLFSSLDMNIILKDRGCNGIATASVDLHDSHAYNLVKL